MPRRVWYDFASDIILVVLDLRFIKYKDSCGREQMICLCLSTLVHNVSFRRLLSVASGRAVT